MTQLDRKIDWIKVVAYGTILLLSIVVFKSCQGSKELELANAELKKEAKEYIASSDKYIAKNNALNDKITVLETQKQKIKTEIVYIESQTESDIEKVGAFNTLQMANYYEDRYELPVVITQYGISLTDTIAKKNIVELVQKDGCFKEVVLYKDQLKIEENKGSLKDSIIDNYTESNGSLKSAISSQEKIISNAEKFFRKEKRKKTFWKLAFGAITTYAGYLLFIK